MFAAGLAAVTAAADGIRAALHEPPAPVLLTGGIATEGDTAGQWLAAGTVPGPAGAIGSMAARALLDLHLSTRANGAVVAGWHGRWEYDWPRDSSWVAVAFAVTGHGSDGLRVLRFLRTVQLRNGTWAARYRLDGRGPVRDGRPVELDADGWVPWAVWSWFEASGPDRATTRGELAGLWPMVGSAADAAERSLSPAGLPGRAIDYWEHGAQVTLGTAALSDDTQVALSSSNPAVASVPASIFVPKGSLTGGFFVSTTAVSTATTVTITASGAGVTQSATLTVNPTPPQPLIAPALISPANGARLSFGTTTSFNWSDISGAASYTIQVSTSSSFSSTVVNQTVTATQFATSSLPKATLFWRVRANDAAGNPGTWANALSFRVN